ncbi:TatD family deoxyribonuclease [Thiospirochaeta perfilievii]|uniref:TatD family deoxyribonuclease n=1 Tax=Thiospirochaeta perfilievii TaxID=252967 RepID=A0A5C1Q804_9SPIO|nr:TatD family hydrolase [Thiospirochaeta perfilievii]QEN03601.1 TatD family deoxyribonuclease [Thiospirochaeta perfilievii]
MKHFDSHVHIGLINDDPMEQLMVIQKSKQQKISKMLSICNNLIDFDNVYNNLISESAVYHAVGVSPSEVIHPGKDWERKIEERAALKRVVAVGETGLDYYRKFGDKNSQIDLFIRQLEIADHLDLPVVIHNREAGVDILDILKDKLPRRGGVLHCYSEDWKFAQKVLNNHDNLYISFAGNVTYRNARTLQETAYNMPLERMVVETESPFMVSSAHKGKRNMPFYLPATVEFLAELREMDVTEFADTIYKNTLELFNINE